MSVPGQKIPGSVEAFLEGKARAEFKHEYLAGEVYAMTGASAPHNLIAGNLFSALHASTCAASLAGSGWRR